LTENQNLRTNLAEITKTTREDAVKARVKQLQDAKFPPGFCRIAGEIMLGDDGMPAATLNLSDSDGNQTGEREYTATEIVERLIGALPKDDSGKVAFADKADLLTSPLSERPPLDPADQEKAKGEGDP